MNTQGLDAIELHGEEAQQSVAQALAGELTLQEIPESEDQRKQRVLGSAYKLSSKNAAERRCAEAAAIRADLAYNHMKNSGQLLRDEIARAQVEERRWGVA